MADNIFKFRRTKWADPKRFKLIADSKPRWPGSRYLSGLIVLFVLIGFVAVQAWPKRNPETARSAATPTALSVRVIDGDTISVDDGKPNIRLVGFNAPETGTRARCEAERQKGEA